MGMTIAAMPAFNEEANIAKLVLQAEQHVDTVSWWAGIVEDATGYQKDHGHHRLGQIEK